MSAYKYEAITQSGKKKNGVIDADSERHVRQKLREQALIPVVIKPINANSSQQKVSRYRLKLKDLALVTRQLATLVSANLPLERALQGVIEQNDKPQIKEIITGIRSKVLEGFTLSNALKSFPKVFSPLYCETVHAGEQTGRLDIVLNRLADYTEDQQEMKLKIQQALIYPFVMILVSISIIAFLLTFVIPKIINVFTSTGQTLPELTIVLLNISYFIEHYGWIVLLLLIIAIFLFSYGLKNQGFKRKVHYLILKIPMISYMTRTINTARYAHTLAILISAGVPVLNAMRVSSNLISNLILKKAVQESAKLVKDGRSISRALKASDVFSPMMVHLIASGENSGALEEMLHRAALNQDKEIERIISTGLTLFEPLIILLMGAIVLFIVLATLLPIFSMNQLVQ